VNASPASVACRTEQEPEQRAVDERSLDRAVTLMLPVRSCVREHLAESR